MKGRGMVVSWWSVSVVAYRDGGQMAGRWQMADGRGQGQGSGVRGQRLEQGGGEGKGRGSDYD